MELLRKEMDDKRKH
jgi:growth arrest-specific protein 8